MILAMTFRKTKTCDKDISKIQRDVVMLPASIRYSNPGVYLLLKKIE